MASRKRPFLSVSGKREKIYRKLKRARQDNDRDDDLPELHESWDTDLFLPDLPGAINDEFPFICKCHTSRYVKYKCLTLTILPITCFRQFTHGVHYTRFTVADSSDYCSKTLKVPDMSPTLLLAHNSVCRRLFTFLALLGAKLCNNRTSVGGIIACNG